MTSIRFTVCSFNLWEEARKDLRRESLTKFLEIHRPDILCAQEFRPWTQDLIDAVLADHHRVQDPFEGWLREVVDPLLPLDDQAVGLEALAGGAAEDGAGDVLPASSAPTPAKTLTPGRRLGALRVLGSVLTPFFCDGPVTDWTSAARCDTRKFARFFHGMLDRGIYLPPSQFEAMFVGAAHTPAMIERTLRAAAEVVRGL